MSLAPKTKVSLTVLTQSAVRAFRSCPRKYENTYVKLYRSRTVSDPIYYGNLWHGIRENIWKRESIFWPLEIDPYLLARLEVMAQGYLAAFGHWLEGVEIVSVEEPFEIALVNPRTDKASRTFTLQGKLDGIVRENGQLWNCEEKTRGGDVDDDDPYWRRLEIDPQVSLYHVATTEKYGETPRGTIYFVCVKPGIKPYKATPKEKWKYTAEKSIQCKQCKKEPGSGPHVFLGDGEEHVCTKEGRIITEPSRLHASVRVADETPEEFKARLIEVVSKDPDRYFKMVRVPRLEKDIEESRLDVWDTAQAILAAKNSGTYLRNPDSCIHAFGMTCDFFPVCTNRASLDDPLLYRKAETSHEELMP